MDNNLESTLEKVGRVIADKYGIKVICKGKSCLTDGRTIYLPSLPSDIPDELMGVIRAYLDHEVGHIAGNSDMTLAGKFQEEYGKDAFGVFNTLEDLRVEKFLTALYAGCGINLKAGYDYAVKKLGENKDSLSPLKQVMTALYSRGSGREDLDFIDNHAYELCDEVRDLISESVNAQSTEEVYPLAVKVWEKVKDYSDDEEPEEPDSSEDQDSNAENSESKKSSSSDEPEEQDGNSNNEEDSSSQEDSAQERQESSGSPMSSLGEFISDIVEEHSSQKTSYRVWSTALDKVHTPKVNNRVSHKDIVSDISPYVSGVRQHLMQSLKALDFSRWIGDKEEGAINHKALHRLISGTSSRVFKQKVKGKVKSTASSLLIDLSGSMGGTKLDLAGKSALIFCEALEKLSIPSNVIGFTTTEEDKLLVEAQNDTGMTASELMAQFRFVPLNYTVFKNFNESFRAISSRFSSMKEGNLTPLGEALLFTALKLKNRPEERKIIFCLTDGRPVVGLANENLAFNHAVNTIANIEKAGIEVILIGICEPCVKQLHSKHVVVNDLEELPRLVVRQLRTILSKQ